MTVCARFIPLILFFLLQPAAAFGGILISMQNTNIISSGFIDVMVSSTATPGAPDLLDSFSAKLVLTPVGSGRQRRAAVQQHAKRRTAGAWQLCFCRQQPDAGPARKCHIWQRNQ